LDIGGWHFLLATVFLCREISYKDRCNPLKITVLTKGYLMNKSELTNAIAEQADLSKADTGRVP
jgi:hypothetical protein